MRTGRWIRALLLIVAMAAPAGAQQIFPSDVKDPELLRNLEFLYDQIRIVRSSVNYVVPATIALYVPLAGNVTMTGFLTIAGTSVTANSFHGAGDALTFGSAEGAVQYIKSSKLAGLASKLHFNETTGTFGIGVTTATTRGVMISSSVIAEMKLCSMAGGPNCGGIFSAASGINIYTTVEADGSLRFNSAGANRGGFSTGGAFYLGTDPVAAAGGPGALYATAGIEATSFVATAPNPGVSAFAGNVSVVGTISGSTITATGGLVLPEFSLAALRTMAPSVVRLEVSGPGPNYDNYKATGTGVGQWINMRTQVGP